MATKCWSTVRGCKMRATLIDECGKPVEGPCSTITNECFVTVSYSAEIEEGDELLLKNACGDVCVVDRGCPELKYYNVEIEFGQVDPDLFAMLTGQNVVNDYKGDAVGIQVGEKINCRQGFALEVWTIIPAAACEPGQTTQNYGYFLIPWLTNGIMGDFTIENDVMTFSVTAQSRDNHQWNKGPYNVVAQDAAQTPGRLLAVLESDKHLHMQVTSIEPPAAVCGCQELEYCTEPSAVISILNDADGDGTFSDNESAAAPGTTVPVQITVTNTGSVNSVVQSLTITDENGLSYDLVAGSGTLPASGSCPIPAELGPAENFVCTVNLLNYSPTDDVEITLTGAVVLANIEDEFCTDRDSDTTTLRTDDSQPPLDQMVFQLFTESGAESLATGPGGTTQAGILAVQCGAPDEVDRTARIAFDVNDLEDITMNTLTLSDSLGNSYEFVSGAGLGVSWADLSGVGCAAFPTHLPNTTCDDFIELPTQVVNAWQTSIEAGVPVTVTLVANATSNDSGTVQVTTRNIGIRCA